MGFVFVQQINRTWESMFELWVLLQQVYSNITYRLTQRHRLDFMTLAQFVRVIETLGKLRVGESVKDKQALKILFKEFIRPSKAKYLTTHQLPLVSVFSISDLRQIPGNSSEAL